MKMQVVKTLFVKTDPLLGHEGMLADYHRDMGHMFNDTNDKSVLRGGMHDTYVWLTN